MHAGTEKPIHSYYAPAGSGDDVDLVDFRASQSRGYQSYESASASDDVDNLVESSFGVFFDDGEVSVPADDSLLIGDEAAVSLDLFEDEGFEPVDEAVIDLLVAADDGFDLVDSPADPETDPPTMFGLSDFPWSDDAAIDIDIFADDGFDLDDDPDQPNVSPFADDGFDFDDDSLLDLEVPAADGVQWGDSSLLSLDVFADDSLERSDQAQYKKHWNVNFGTTIEVVSHHNYMYSSEVRVLRYDPAAINDLLNPDNPATPSVVINGQTIISHPDTVKASSYNYVSVNPSTFIAGCDLLDLVLNQTVGAGGNFQAKTRTPFGVKGQIVTIAGIKCLITSIVEASGDQQGDFYITTGSVGDARIMNKDILLVLDSPELAGLGNLALNTPLQAPSSLQWTTCSEAAQAVANAAGIHVAWLAPDAPLTDLALETGSKVGSTIESLGKRVNAELCFDGKETWAIVDPMSGYGGWAGVPNCGLFGTSAFEVESFLDLDSGFVSLPIKPQSAGTVSQSDNPASPFYAAPTPKEQIQSFNTKPNEGDAPVFLPLNADYDKFYLQIFLPTTDSKIVQGKFIPGVTLPSGVVQVPNSTVDPDVWKEFTFNKIKDKLGKESLVIDHSLFHDDLVDNQFSLNIGYTRKVGPLAEAFAQQQQEAIERRRFEDAYNSERLRYFNTRTATIRFKFFGTLPVPGNKVSLSYKNKSISGMVYSCTLRKSQNSIAEVELTVREHMVNNLLMPRSILDFYFATGTTP